MALLKPSERAAARVEVTRILHRGRAAVLHPGPKTLIGLVIFVAALIAVAQVTSLWWAVILGIAGLIGAVAVALGREIWRYRTKLRRLLRRYSTRGRPGAQRYEQRSAPVARLVNRWAQGHETRAQRALTEMLESGDTNETTRHAARCALVDLAILAGDGVRARELLTAGTPGPAPTEWWAFQIETAVMLSDARALKIPPQVRNEMAKDSQLRYLLANTGPVDERVKVLTNALVAGGFGPVSAERGRLEDLRSQPGSQAGSQAGDQLGDQILVSIIVPAYNAADTIGFVLRSLRSQTWVNLEIIVVDDVSTDTTCELVRQIAEEDDRVRLITRQENGGAYRARNTGLGVARGNFVTVNDGDDWAHCEKIETQVRHLLDHPEVVANVTSMVRSTAELDFVRRGIPHGDVCGYNYSSLMVRRSALDEVGPWDDVVVEGDSELLGRLRSRFGAAAVAHLYRQVPLSVTLRTSQSLTQGTLTGLGSHQHSTGIRRIYGNAYRHWHTSPNFVSDLPLRRTDDRTPFAAPPLVRRRNDAHHHFEVLLMSDLGLPGGTTASNLTEIEANELHGLRTGLVHNRNPRFADEGVNPKFLQVHSHRTRLVTAGEKITTDVMVIKYPPTALEIPDRFPEITVTGEVLMVVNQTPMTSYSGSDRRLVYEIGRVDAEVSRALGRSPLWIPVGPAVREVLQEHHQSELAAVRVAPDDWVEIIDQDRWRRAARPDLTCDRPTGDRSTGDRPIRIGRHGRDSEWKWPSSKAGILEVYPADPRFEVRILGGADVARDRMGSIPSNWQVLAFDEVSPAAWLSELDVFVSFPHPDMVEAFGRTLLEALAVGVPVVTDTRFAELFGDAVIACAPDQALGEVNALMADADRYHDMVQRGARLVQERFGYDAHLRRLLAMGLQR